jgi:hypothetical protein
MPSCLRIATLLRALEKVLLSLFLSLLSSFLGVLGDGDGVLASKTSITWRSKKSSDGVFKV